MKKLISMTLFAAVFCCLQARTASAKELYKCSDSRYHEISCAGQQSYGWGCKAGSEACSPTKSGDCSCGALTTGPTGPAAAGSVGAKKGAGVTAGGSAVSNGGIISKDKPQGQSSGVRQKSAVRPGAHPGAAAGLSAGTAKVQDRNIPGNQILPTSITENKCTAKPNCEVLQGQGPAFAKWCHCMVLKKHDYELIN